jgi:2-polyprenyl-3-methyl-5-hydroxy-6-metoxy-1,4-benzoquinol methylase
MNENSEYSKPKDAWASADEYEQYVGRWSRVVASEFLKWLPIPEGSAWLDIGCGTGVLSQTILQFENPVRVKGIDRSEGFVAFAKEHTQDSRSSLMWGMLRH